LGLGCHQSYFGKALNVLLHRWAFFSASSRFTFANDHRYQNSIFKAQCAKNTASAFTLFKTNTTKDNVQPKQYRKFPDSLGDIVIF
jgi:hypothetical protein